MISKLDANDLFDVYGDLLTKRQREILSLYYEEDFSYTEISEELEISRAAAMDSVHRATKLLEKYEAAIGYVAKKKLLDAWILQHEDVEQIEILKEIFSVKLILLGLFVYLLIFKTNSSKSKGFFK